jgi:hypothetical protein
MKDFCTAKETTERNTKNQSNQHLLIFLFSKCSICGLSCEKQFLFSTTVKRWSCFLMNRINTFFFLLEMFLMASHLELFFIIEKVSKWRTLVMWKMQIQSFVSMYITAHIVGFIVIFSYMKIMSFGHIHFLIFFLSSLLSSTGLFPFS